MNKEQLKQMHEGKGFIAALDQSGGSTPKALAQYGISEDAYSGEDQMFTKIHEMRTRIITSPSFDGNKIIGAILFENTMDRAIDGIPTADYLWEKKGVVPFLKVDKGLADEKDGVQLMKPMPELDALLDRAVAKNVFGTKMRSVIHSANKEGIKAIVDQQFEVGLQIWNKGLVPIIEPEVNILSADKAESEKILKEELIKHLEALDDDVRVIFKLSIPTEANFYEELMSDPHVVRVVALSGGYSRIDANDLLTKNHGLIASFSRALSEGLHADQSQADFDALLGSTVDSIYQASIK